MYVTMHLYNKRCERIRLLPCVLKSSYLSSCISIRDSESELCIFIDNEATIVKLEQVLEEARQEMRKGEDKAEVWYPADEQRGE